MSPLRIVGLVLLAVGVVLLVLAYNASQSTAEEIREAVTGKYSDETVWYLILGIAGLIGGGALAIFGGRRRTA